MKQDSTVLVQVKPNSAKSLENFALHIEEQLRLGKDKLTMERLICRLLTGKDAKVSAVLAAKWVEWRYGKAKETLEVKGHIEHEHFDASKLTDEQLALARAIIESASIGSDRG